MQLITPSKLQQKKLKEMILKLFPEYGYVTFNHLGIVFLSKSFWWNLFSLRKSVHITELCTVYIPERLEKIDLQTKINNGNDTPYKQLYNKYSYIVLDLLHNRANNIIDYLYDEYTFIKYGIHKVYHTEHHTLPEFSHTLSEVLSNPIKKDGIVLSQLSNVYIKQALKRWKNATSVLNHPVLYRNFLNMFFREEVKKITRQFYDINIALNIA